MATFFPEQRWVSEGEPELGVGVVTEITKGRVTIHFSTANETRMYAMADAPLRRVIFKPGETIRDKEGESLLIERVQEGDLILYIGADRALSEADLGDVAISHGVEDQLLMGEVGTPDQFSLRRKTLDYDYHRKISPINGFIGGRIDLIPHQLYIAHEVSSRYAPRVLLSDQVGLGKTIEACLIIHRLLLSGRVSRVMILVPDSLVHQWFVELLRRFNLWFNIFDEERCEAIQEGAPEGNPFLEDQLVICSTSFLANAQERTRQALAANWDMLVVDEAHHLAWSLDTVSKDYAVVELLSRVAKGLLLLTATPEQLGAESHFARLRLLDPDRYADFEDFKNESQDNSTIANLVEDLSSGKELTTNDMQLLETLFDKERIASASNEDDRNNLIEDLLDQHGPGRVVFRNTRSAMKGFPKREAHLAPLRIDDNYEAWVENLSDEFTNDLEEASNKTRNNNVSVHDPRITWLVKTLEALVPNKVLLICKTKEKVLSIEKALLEHSSVKVGVFHEDLTIVQRDRNAAWFSDDDGARLLLCSEIGSEGRNFQFAHHLILFDLPFHPELLEQRIGRLDRIGQTDDIHIHIPYLEGTPQEVLALWFHKGLNAFEENIEGGNHISQLFSERVLNCTSLKSNKEELATLIADTAKFRKELRVTLAEGRDRLLEMNSFRPQKANELIEQINKADIDMKLEYFMTRVFENFGIEMEDLAARSYLLRPSRANNEAFPSVPDQGVSVTFDRTKALSREDLSFISWDHPMATGALDMVLSTGTGNASFGILREEGKPAILLEVLFVLEVVGGKSVQVDRFLPNTPLRIVVDHTGEDVTAVYTEQKIDDQIIPGPIDTILENETLTEVLFPNMIKSAAKYAEELGAHEIFHGLKKMEGQLNHEIERLEFLHEKNSNIRREEIELAIDEKNTLASLIQSASVRMDAVQLIQKG